MPTSPRTPRQRCHSEPVLTLAWESASPVPCLSLWERWPSAARTERANREEPPPGGPFQLVDKPILSFRGAPQGYLLRARSDVGIRSPRPQARNLQSLPCVKGGVARRATEGLSLPGGAEPRPYTRLPIAFAPSVRADVGIRPYEITGGVCVIRTGGQSRPPLRPSTVPAPYPCSVIPRSEATWESVPRARRRGISKASLV